MKNCLAYFAVMISAFLVILPANAQDTIKVTLLGTAGPEYFPDRLGISTLVEANGQKLTFRRRPRGQPAPL